MKKITYNIFYLIGFILLFSSCEEMEKEVYDDSSVTPPVLTGPTSISLNQEIEDETIRFEWTKVDYGLTHPVSYEFQVTMADSGFEKPLVLGNTEELFYETTVAKLNNAIRKKWGLDTINYQIQFRTVSYVANVVPKYEEPLSYNIKFYMSVDFGQPLFLIGDATPTGWSNPGATQMIYIGKDKYELFVYLQNSGAFKFIQVQGNWAPQYGLDAGTTASGTLKLRPTEDDEDPPAIGAPADSGYYKIEVDLAQLKYTTTPVKDAPAGMHLVGDATLAGWDFDAPVPMNRVCEIVTEEKNKGMFFVASETKFHVTTTLKGSGAFKFLKTPGTFAPQWGFASAGKLAFRPDEETTDPASIDTPGGGEYVIEMDIEELTYSTTAK